VDIIRTLKRISPLRALFTGFAVILLFSPIVSFQNRYPIKAAEFDDFGTPDNITTQTIFSDDVQPVFLLRVFDTSIWNPPSPDPVGIDYHPGLEMLIIADSEVDEMPGIFKGVNIYLTSLKGQLLTTCSTMQFSKEPTGVAVNPEDGHIFFSDDSLVNKIFEVGLVENGQGCPLSPPIRSFNTDDFNSFDAEGLTFGMGKMFVVDGRGAKVFILSPGNNGIFDGAQPAGDDLVDHFDTASIGLRNPKGIAFDPERGSLFIVSEVDPHLVETTPEGTVLSRYDISFSGIIAPSGVTIGPRSRDPGLTSIYITDRGIDNDIDPTENDGKVYEFAIPLKNYIPMICR
jgi:hypothetical protein